MNNPLAAIRESSFPGSTASNDAGAKGTRSQVTAATGGSGASGSSVPVEVSARPALAADQQYSAGAYDSRQNPLFGPEPSAEASKVSFLKRASRRIRRSLYGYGAPWTEEGLYRDSLLVPDPQTAEAAKAARRMSLPAMRRLLLPHRWQQSVCNFCDSIYWNCVILLITLFSVFAPDIATVLSAPDYANNWINGFIVAIMGIFAAETAAYLTCRPAILWLQVGLDVVSNLSLLFAITWFTTAVGLRSDGTTSDAARACRILRLVRVASFVELLSWKARQWRESMRSRASSVAAADNLKPSNIGRKIAETTTLQVALVVVATVVGTSLLIGADIDSAGAEGLAAFGTALAAAAASGAVAPQLNATVGAMVAFSQGTLDGKQVPMELQITSVDGTLSWDWTAQNGGWTARSTDRLDLTYGVAASGAVVSNPAAALPPLPLLVRLAVSTAHANHLRAGYNMLLALVVIVLLLAFVVLFNWSIWKMLVKPLDRIFHIIHTNAAQVVAALGPQTRGKKGQSMHHGGGVGGPGASSAEDIDMHTIEAAVEKMSRILEQYTSTGGVGLNAVKKMANNADQSTKEWLATMVAGPGSAEVALGASTSSAASSFAIKASSAHRSGPIRSDGVGSLPTSPPAAAAGPGPGSGPGLGPGPRQPRRTRQSRLGRMSGALIQGSPGGGALLPRDPMRFSQGDMLRRSSLHHLAGRCSATGTADPVAPDTALHRNSGLFAAAASPSGHAAVGAAAGASTPGSPASSTQTAVAPGLSSGSVDLDAAAIAATAAEFAQPAVLLGGDPEGRDARAGVSRSRLSEAQKVLLAQVDLDYLHSFSFDALALPAPLLPACLCAMFLELDLAFFGSSDAEGGDDAEGPGFVDVATLWSFVEEVSGIYQPVLYHNFRHCVDVTHTTFMFIKRVGHKVALTGLERFALMVAAVSHDMEHPGLNNAYLVNTSDPLATTYNDSSVLENRHVACLYSLLLSKPHLNIFARLDPAQWREVRKAVIGAVLATDMVHHFPMVSRLEVFYELHAATIHAHHRALRQGLPRESLPRLFDGAEERQLLLNLILHCADISNPVKPTHIAEKWSERVLDEFFAQGDRERAAGLAISPMCDRTKTSRASSQIKFIEFVVAPIYAQVYKIFPELGEAVDNLAANRHFWQDELHGELMGLGATGPGAAEPLTPERRAEEMAKADKRLRDFQDKYRDILSRRKHQLTRLASVHACRTSMLTHTPTSTHHQLAAAHAQYRHNSLQLFVEQSDPSRTSSGGGDPGSLAGGLLGRLARLTQGHRLTRGQRSVAGSVAGSVGSVAASSGRSSDASEVTADAAQALADLQARAQPGSNLSRAATPGRRGLGSRVAPDDAV